MSKSPRTPKPAALTKPGDVITIKATVTALGKLGDGRIGEAVTVRLPGFDYPVTIAARSLLDK